MQHAEGYVPIQDGLRLYYHSIGDGPDTVLLASACSLDIDLAPLAQGRQLVFYDQRGRGRSDPDPDPSHIWTDYEPRDLEAVREHFGLERVSLIGWPYNGGVTALYAMEHPDRVNRLVLMCSIAPRQPAPYDDDDAQQRKADSRLDPAAVKRLEEMRQAGLETRDPVACAREHRRVYLPRQMGKPEALARSSQDPSLFSNEWLTNRSEHWKRHFPDSSWERDWRSRAAWLDIPTLVIHGSEDLIPVEASREWVTTLPNARLVIIPGSGHFPHLEAPEVYFPAVDRFLAGEWPEGAEVA